MSGGRPSALVVEDEPPLRELIVVTLGSAFDCREAATGEEALELLRESVPDLVLVDVMLPGKSGIELLTEMRGDPALRHVPVIVLSAWQAPDVIERALHAGANRFVSKPFQVEELASVAEELVRGAG